MRALPLILGFLLITPLPAIARGKDAIAVSLLPTVLHAKLGQPVLLTVIVTNTSSTPRYIGRDVIGLLEYAVKNSAGHVLRGLDDPPRPAPEPREDEDLVWLKPREALSFNQRLTLASLGIEATGTYRIVAFLNGTVATEAMWRSNKYGSIFSFSPAVTIIVEGDSHDAQRKNG